MARVVLTASADADTVFILSDLTKKAGVNVAERYDAEFDAVYRCLEAFPKSGSPRPKLGRLVRIGIVWLYIIIHEYIEADDVVTVMRILHGHRRITRRILNRPPNNP